MFFKGKPTIAISHPNIALVKYWGKSNEKLILPTNSSVSLTIDNFFTKTAIEFDASFKEDKVKINGKIVKKQKLSQFSEFLNVIRNKANSNLKAHVESFSNIPLNAGLASSSAGFAALGTAASYALNIPKLNKKELSKIVRRGSGSATRSIFGGFVEWKKGTKDNDSYAIPIESKVNWDINIIAVEVKTTPKKLSSREGMKRSKLTSPYYDKWIKIAEHDILEIKNAIKNKDFSKVGQIAENNALAMHALTISARPSFTYFNEDSLKVINLVKKLRSQGIECYFTLDAGPNVKIITRSKNIPPIVDHLSNSFNKDQIIITHPGSGTKILKN